MTDDESGESIDEDSKLTAVTTDSSRVGTFVDSAPNSLYRVTTAPMGRPYTTLTAAANTV